MALHKLYEFVERAIEEVSKNQTFNDNRQSSPQIKDWTSPQVSKSRPTLHGLRNKGYLARYNRTRRQALDWLWMSQDSGSSGRQRARRALSLDPPPPMWTQ